MGFGRGGFRGGSGRGGGGGFGRGGGGRGGQNSGRNFDQGPPSEVIGLFLVLILL